MKGGNMKKQSKSFGKKMNAKTTFQKGNIATFAKMAKKTLAKNVRKGKGPARKGGK